MAYASRGPVPKREVARRRRNKTDDSGNPSEATSVELDPEEFPAFVAPAPNPHWHPAALAIWEAAAASGTRVFWEPSDWSILALTCSQISQEYADDLIIEKVKLPIEAGGAGGGEELVYGSRPMPSGKFSAVMKALGMLGLTEGDRRRMHIELERFAKPDEVVTEEQFEDERLRLIQGGAADAG